MEIANDQRVHTKFVTLYKQIHGSDSGELVFAAEKFHFAKQISEKPALQKCTPMSLYGALIDIAVQNLSVDPAKKLAYLVPYGDKCVLQISGYGELMLRILYGQIKYAEKPVVVYEGDEYKVGIDKNGKKYIRYSKKIPRDPDAPIIASFIVITRTDGSVEFIDFDAQDHARWRAASKQPNSDAWVKHLSAMIATKTIKHAFGTYPKLKLSGAHTKLETEIDETEDIDYGLVDEDTGEIIEVKADAVPPKEEGYGDDQNAEPEGVTAPDDEDDGF